MSTKFMKSLNATHMFPTHIRRTFRTAAVLTAASASALTAQATSRPANAATTFDPFRLDAPLPTDPAVRVGKLPNGLTYYIRQNAKPEKRVELRLVVNAGSVLEDNDQRGLAHFLEHMAFNGTKNFPKTEVVKYLESIGVRFGADLNANTSFDETIYILPVPTDSAGILEKSFQFLSDVATNITFDSLQVVGERGVVLEEWRGRLGAGERILDKQLPVFLAGSRYADRLPIGLPTIIEAANPAPLRRFWSTWYRPDLMSVVVVGDLPPDRMQALVTKYFSGVVKRAAPRARVASVVPNVDSTRISILKDKELTNTQLSVRWQQAASVNKTVADYRTSTVERLMDAMLNMRLSEIAQRPDAPFLVAGAARGNFVRPLDIYLISATPKEGMSMQALQVMLAEAERVRQHGFLQSELDRARTNTLRGYERAFDERGKTESAAFVEEYIAHFLSGESFPGIAYETDLVRKHLPLVTLEEVNRLARAERGPANRTVAITSPDKDGLAVPTEADVKKVLSSLATATVAAYTENIAEGALVPNAPAAGKVVTERVIADVGLTEWVLSNKVRVFVKPTDYKADEILMRAWSPGGISQLPDADVLRAQQAADAMGRGGLGNYSLVDFRKKMTGKAANVAPFIAELSEGLNGSASPKDLETMMQLIWLRLQAPRADTSAFQAMIQQYTAALANKDLNPQSVFSDTVSVTLAQGSPRIKPLDVARLQELNLNRMEEIYRDRLSDATDLTFLFVGTIDLAMLKPLVEQWIGALPASGRKEVGKDVGPKMLTGSVDKTVKKGIAPQSNSLVLMMGNAPWTREQSYIASSLGELLEMRLLERLREAMGGTYGVSVSASLTRVPRQEWQTAIQFGSAPDRAEALYKAVLQEMDSLKRVPPTAAEVERVREQQRRELEVARKQNSYWMSALSTKIEFGDDPSSVLQAEQLIAALTPAQLMEAAKKYLDTTNIARFVLQPEAAPKVP
ncbi:MAG: insulinase family protein [Phycisphaerae bacterium]|nr:insulinase family protein [Gemmatimonadaceae bacterium]